MVRKDALVHANFDIASEKYNVAVLVPELGILLRLRHLAISVSATPVRFYTSVHVLILRFSSRAFADSGRHASELGSNVITVVIFRG